MRVILEGPDDIIPKGAMRVNLDVLPRVGELMVWERPAQPAEYFRVAEVCHIFTGPMNEALPPHVSVEPVEGP